MSPATAVDFFSSIISASGAKCGDFFISESGIRKTKNKKMRKMAEDKRKSWIPPKPSYVGWDEKVVTRYGEKGIRMPVVVGGDERGPQHLESELLSRGTGECIAEGVRKACHKWGVSADKPETIPAIQLFDTTSSNTGTACNPNQPTNTR